MLKVSRSDIVPHKGPFLVQERPFVPQAHGPLELWHLLSLDAPTVAVTWTVFLSWCSGVHPRALDAVAMFVAVWILYAADRLLDARPLFTRAHDPELRERHHFHHRYRSRFRLLLLLACPLLLGLLHFTADALLHLYILLAVLLGGWLILVHARSDPGDPQHRLPKELVVGPFFATAVCLPTVARHPALREALLPIVGLLALLCSLNCLFLYRWEHTGGNIEAHATTRWALRRLPELTTVIPFFGLLLCWWTAPQVSLATTEALPHTAACVTALSLSALALLWLHTRHRRVRPLRLRSYADAVLLSPLPVMLFGLWTRLRRG